MIHNFKRHIISVDAPMREALSALNKLSGDAMTLIAVADGCRPVGTVTDGDLRRALIRGVSLDAPVADAMNRNFHMARVGEAGVKDMKALRDKRIRLLPVVDGDGRLADLIDLHRTVAVLPLSALIMAGGKGERLRPMTLTTPKPLLSIEGKAIIDYNIENMARVGIGEAFVSTAYLAEQLDEHFASPVAGINVKTVRETTPRGTVGALADVLPAMTQPHILVMNSDLLTDIALEEMYLKHISEHADITVAAISYTVSVPYAILSTEGSCIKALEEKPTYSLYANGGIYMISRRAAALVPSSGRYDATDLISDALASGMKVVYFPVNGTWIDVGTPADFRHAQDIMKYHSTRN